MPITYNVVEKFNPLKPADPKKYYAYANATGEITLRSLSKEIAQEATTVSDTDVLAVLSVLNKALVRNLADGKIVRFGDFGSFQVALTGEGATTAGSFSSSLIKGAKINFRPGTDLKEMLQNLSYEKVR